MRYQQTYLHNPHVFGSYGSTLNQPNFHQKNNEINRYKSVENSSKPYESMHQSLVLTQNNSQLKNTSEVSYARDFKHRLYQADRNQEMKKQIQKISYRKQLELQMKADKDRKKRQKQQLQKWQLQRQKKFYQEAKIQAQSKVKKTQEPSYFILRSSKHHRNKKNLTNSRSIDGNKLQANKISRQNRQDNQAKIPKIMKRGGYHNQSALDNISFPEQKSIQNPQTKDQLPTGLNKPKSNITQQQQLEIVRQRNYQEQRISSIIKLQQKMLRKLDIFKQQIYKTNKHLQLDKQVQKIRILLKSKPIKLDVLNIRDNQIFENNSDFYQFPRVEKQTRNLRNKTNQSRISQGINLNSQRLNSQTGNNQEYLISEKSQQYQNQEQQQNFVNNNSEVRRKREIKLFDRNKDNDKNYASYQKHQSIHLPVVNQVRDSSKGFQNQSNFQNY